MQRGDLLLGDGRRRGSRTGGGGGNERQPDEGQEGDDHRDHELGPDAHRIDHVLRGKGQAGRLGGDEFVAVVPNGPSQAFINSLARRLIAEISAPYHVGSSQIQIGASVGIASGPGDGAQSDDLIRHADLALYAAKQAGRGLYRFYDPAMGATAEYRRSLEMDLRSALTNGQIRLVYQPFFDLQTNRLAGFEALLRWDHPETRAYVDRRVAEGKKRLEVIRCHKLFLARRIWRLLTKSTRTLAST